MEGDFMDLNSKYSELIIRPLEQEIKKSRNNFFMNKYTINKNKDKEHIDKLEKLLFEYYKKFETFIEK